MNWLHLLEAARLLAGSTYAPAPIGRPRQTMLKRAVSNAYYAMFHALCRSNANTIVGTSPAPTYTQEWSRTYRALEHRFASDRMNRHSTGRPLALQDFATVFTILQEHRHRADYDPEAAYLRREVTSLIDRAETATQAFLASSAADRRALATIVLLRDR